MQSQLARARSPIGLARALRRGILLAVTAGLVAVPAANAATYPVAGGNGFDSNAEGWTGVTATCSPNAGSLCTEENLYSGTQGNPPGSIESRMDVIVNGGTVFTAQGTWRSPSFEANANGSGTMKYDRRLEVSGLNSLNPGASVEVVLVNESTGDSQSVGSEGLTSANSAFVTRTIAVPDETLSVGDSYHLELRTTTSTSQAQVGLTGSVSTRFDNVALKVQNEGPGGSSGSPGVTFTGPPLSSKEIEKQISKFNWSAEKGNLPGGSVVARKDCTIVGTPGRDRIIGSKGNDVICGLGGNDKINGRGGKDLIDGGSGNDSLNGSTGKDALAGLAGKDVAQGGAANDRVGGGASADRASGSAGNDLLKAGSGADRLSGNAGNDRLSGGKGFDRISGGSGKDRAIGNVGHDRLTKVERRG
jgi:Ca2+-binding RTX toxin-like protein